MGSTPMTMENNEVQVRRVTFMGLIINILLSIIKIIAGFYGNSQAVIADGFHSMSDTSTDFAVIAGSYFWSKPPDASHPYGHKRIETIIAISIGIILLAAGSLIGVDAVLSLKKSPPAGPPSFYAFWATLASIVIKEGLYRWTITNGKQLNSLALTANAWHHRLDAISSIPVFFAVGISIFWPAYDFVDQVGAIFVSLLIVYASFKIIYTGLHELIDAGAPQEVCDRIHSLATGIHAVHQVHGIRTRYMGSALQVDLHVVVDGAMTVTESHAIAHDIEERIRAKGPNVIGVVVHIEPLPAAIPTHANTRIKDTP